MSGVSRSSLFISYRRADSPDTVKLIYERLNGQLPQWDVFYDHKSIALGEPFPEILRQRVTSANVVLVVIGPKWLESLQQRKNSQATMDHVREEVRIALQAGRTVIPVSVLNATMLSPSDLSDFSDLLPLASLNARAIRPEPDFDHDIDQLIGFLDQIGPGEGVGTVLAGKYKLIREVGAGGMGIVYAAEQLQPRRTVAVKLIKPGMDSREIIARFDAERQALAVMDHPNIARVLDAGTGNSGRPFFVMDFVRGTPITEYCDQNKLALPERLELFRSVCNAIQHSHQKGILHRDIKPTNVLVELVDGVAVPKVIDFGLAKALGYKLTDKTLLTTIETRVGTLEYSSPEQCAGRSQDIDTRTDIYSLGALLYELLTGSPPFDREELLRGGEEEVKRMIREVDPLKPSMKLDSSNAHPPIASARRSEPGKLARMLRGELDWIVMRALDKEPGRRYETTNALSRDVERFLANEPVEARPPGKAYLLKKFLRRNRGPVAAAIAILVVLLGGLTGIAVALNSAIVEGKRADNNARLAGKNATAARFQAEVALDALSFMLNEIQSGCANVPGAGAVQRRLLDSALDRLEQVSGQFVSQATIDHNTLNALIDLGGLMIRIGTEGKPGNNLERPLASARRVYQQANDIAEKLAAENPNDLVAQRDLAISYEKLGEIDMRSSQLSSASIWFEKSLHIYRKLADANPGNLSAQRDLSMSYLNQGDVHRQSGKTVEALEFYTRLLSISEKLVAADSNNMDYLRGLSLSYDRLGFIQTISGQPEAAKQSYVKLLEISEKRAAGDPNDSRARRDLYVAHIHLGELHFDSNQLEEALKSYEQALNISRKLAEADPNDFSAQRDLSTSHNRLANVQFKSGQSDAALKSYQTSLAISQELAALDPSDTQAQHDLFATFNEFGEMEFQLGRFAEAIQSYGKALQISRNLADADPGSGQAQVAVFVSYFKLGQAHFTAKSFKQSADTYGAGADVLRKMIEAGMYVEESKRQLTDVEASQKQAELADSALKDWEQLLTLPEDQLIDLLQFRADYFVQAGNTEEAVKAAAKIRDAKTATAAQLYEAARVYSRSAAAIPKDPDGPSEPAAEQTRDEYIQEAITTLKELIAAGLEDFDRLRSEADWSILAERPEFVELLNRGSDYDTDDVEDGDH